MGITIAGISKRFGAFAALKGIDLQVPSGELVALLGPSGSGKTTLLRIIAGLEAADGGRILFNGEDTTNTPVGERNVGFVFQHYALFRHMTVFENIAFGLRVRPRNTRPANDAIRARVRELLSLVQLEDLAQRYPHQISGGQRQRIALARALAVAPRVLLLDEPFGALDAKVRKELRVWLRRLHDDVHVTSVFVTHDQEEALEVADRVVVMNEGRIEQIGTPEEVYEHPATPFVYGFLGNVNELHGRAHHGRLHVGAANFDAPAHYGASEVSAVAFVRPHEVEIERTPSDGNGIAVQLGRALIVGPTARVELSRCDNAQIIKAELSAHHYRELNLSPGERLWVRPRAMRVFAETRQSP
jgi:sulfate transport system ATP-binding protein